MAVVYVVMQDLDSTIPMAVRKTLKEAQEEVYRSPTARIYEMDTTDEAHCWSEYSGATVEGP